MKRLLIWSLAGTAATALLAGCFDKSTPDWDYMPDMYHATYYRAQSEDVHSPDGAAARVPPDGTIPRGYEPYHYNVDEGEKAGKELVNPLPRTKSVLDRGAKQFNTYCIVCHGPKGDGSGFVVPPFPHPPSLLTDKIINYPDGRIFHIITMGQNVMPSYRSQIKPADRWAIVHYVRALEKAAHPTDQDESEYQSTTAQGGK